MSIPRLSVEAGGAELTAGSAARLFFLGGDPDETWDMIYIYSIQYIMGFNGIYIYR